MKRSRQDLNEKSTKLEALQTCIYLDFYTMDKSDYETVDVQELQDFLRNLKFILEVLSKHIRSRFLDFEGEPGILYDCLIALSALENALAGSVIDRYELRRRRLEEFRNAVYNLAKTFEPLFYSDRIKEMLDAPKAPMVDETADKNNSSPRWAKVKDAPAKFVQFLHISKAEDPIVKDMLCTDEKKEDSDPDLYSVYPDLKLIYPPSEEVSEWDYYFGHSHSRLLLVTGEPGCGKSNLLLHISRELLRSRSFRNSLLKNQKVAVNFCDSTDSVEDCISSVVQQLQRAAEPDATQHMAPNFNAMSNALCDIVRQETYPIYVVIDGLDKCCNLNNDGAASNLASLFKLIFKTTRLSRQISWIVSVRSFEAEMLDKDLLNYCHDLTNMSRLLAKRLASLQVDTFFKATGIDKSLQKHFEAQLVEKSKGDLLWIKLAGGIIRRDPKNACKTIYDLGEQIEDLYPLCHETLRLTIQEDEYFKEILTIMAAAYRPLSISELQSLITVPYVANLKEMILKTFFFLEVRDDVVYFHRGAKKFLLKQHIVQVLPEAHAKIAHRCLRMLGSSSFYDKVTDQSPIHYAASHWIKHLLRAQLPPQDIHQDSLGLNAALEKFLNRSFIQWLNAMDKALHSVPFGTAAADILQLWDFFEGDHKTSLERSKWLSFSPDERSFAASSKDGIVRRILCGWEVFGFRIIRQNHSSLEIGYSGK
ncbi:hypothetical protein V8C42DRAFT_360481 [Trichoderma barbatum]